MVNEKATSQMENKRVLNIAASWPAIVGDVVNDHAMESVQILPQLLHEASEEAQQQLMNKQHNGDYNWPIERNSNENDENEDSDDRADEQLQSMLENYQKHVIKQKQRQGRKGAVGATGRSASHLQKRINASQQPPMSHSQPCLISSSVGQQLHQKDVSIGGISSAIQQQQTQFSFQNHLIGGQRDGDVQIAAPTVAPFGNGVSPADPREIFAIGNHQQQQPTAFVHSEYNNENGIANSNDLNQLMAQNEKLRKKCVRLEELERACKRIERDYDQMTAQHQRREELQRMAMQKLEQQLRMLTSDNEQLRAQNGRLSTLFGVVGQRNGGTNDSEQQMQFHFLLNELLPKNDELLLIQERQRIELEAQSATLEEQRTHIEVLEKALSNAQERLAAKERSAVDAVAVVDKCSHLQRMLQEALEDKQRQKGEHGRQMAQLEMELTQLRLQFAKDTNSSAIGSIGRKSGGSMALASGTAAEAGMGDEMLKLRKTVSLKDERISQLENGLLEMQRRYNDELKLRETASAGSIKSGERMIELESLAVRLEQEKFEKERRIHELLDEKCHIQMQWNEERRSLDYRVRLLEKDLRHFMGSQSSLASSSGGGNVYGGGGVSGGLVSPYNAGGVGTDLYHNSPYASMRDQNLRHRSSAELPTSARVAALYEDQARGGGCGLDVLARMEGLGRRMAERRAQLKTTERPFGVEAAKLLNIARPSDIGLSKPPTIATIPNVDHSQQLQDQCSVLCSQHPSLPSRSSSSTEQPSHPPPFLMDLSPSSEEPSQHPTNAVTPNDSDGKGMPSQQQQCRQPSLSAASSASSSTKKRHYFCPTTANNLTTKNNVYMEQLSEPTRRRHPFGGTVVETSVADERQQEWAEHQMKEDVCTANGVGGGSAGKPLLTRLGPSNRRGEGGCRRLIRDHSIDARRESRAEQQHPMVSGGATVTMSPPNYQESQQRQQQPFRRELGALQPMPPMPNELPPPYATQMRQMHQMSSIEEPPLIDPPQNPSFPPNYGDGNAGKTVVEVKGEEGDSDTLNSHRQLVYRRSSLGNTNSIK